MTKSRWKKDMGAALALGIGLLASSCRKDASATNQGSGEPGATRSASTAPAQGERASVLTAGPALAAVPSASPSSPPSTRESECGGAPPPGPLPRLEQGKLAAQQEGRYRFELKYPRFHEDNEKAMRKVNQQLFEQLGAIKTRFVKEAESQGGTPDPDNARWFEGKCETAYHSKSFVSVACETMEGPGAHPHLDKFAYNFQICPEVRVLALADVCRALPECRKKIIQLINDDFRTGEKKQTDIQFRDGPVPHGESTDPDLPIPALRTFAITPTGLRFYLFDELPHVLQAFAVIDIPAAKVRPVLRDEIARRLWGP
jgi:hypothetical protein